MKTAEEIKVWLEKQDWYDVFCKRIDEDKYFLENTKDVILNGELLELTITNAFSWINTIEGGQYWEDKNNIFIKWYEEPAPEQMDKNITELIFDTDKTSLKNDRKDNKPRWELLPIEILEEVVKVYTFGAEKYAENSWQNLENGKERYYAALMRHLVAWRKGETKDEESQLHPLSHVIWNAIALLWLEMNNNKQN